MSDAAVSNKRILAHLRTATADAHARVDACIDLPSLDRRRYVGVLLAMRAAQRVVETALHPHESALRAFGYHRDGAALAWLDADITDLARDGDVLCEPATTALDLPTVPAAFGAVYVVEGSTLGGQVIVRQVVPALGLVPPTGCRYFTGYGKTTGARWRETGAAIVRGIDASPHRAIAEAEMIAAAVETFGRFESTLRAVS